MADYYNSEGYASPTEHEAFTRIEKEEKAAAKATAFRPVVYICSPYSGDTERNVENAKKYSRFAVDRHYLPITPHIYFTQFMDDNIPSERDTAIFMNWVLMSKCVELWVFGDTVNIIDVRGIGVAQFQCELSCLLCGNSILCRRICVLTEFQESLKKDTVS